MGKKSLAAMGAGAFVTAAALIGAPATMQSEGMRLVPYYDSVGVRTWCVGETEVGYKKKFEKADCDFLYTIRYGYYSMRTMEFYNATAKAVVTPEVHAAVVDTAYNVGLGAIAKSSIIKKLNAGDAGGACNAILLYKYVGKHDCSAPGNKACPGVWTRRVKMNELCKQGVAHVFASADRA